MTPREELEALRRLNELETKAAGASPQADFSGVSATVDRGPARGLVSYGGERPNNDQAIAAIQSPEFQRKQMARKQDAFRSAPWPARMLVGGGGRAASMVRGFGQIGAAGMDAIAPREQTLSGLITGAPQSRYDEAMQAEAKARENDRFMEGDFAAGAGGFLADVGMLAAPMSKVGKLSRPMQYATNAGIGAGMGGLQPVVDGESRAVNTGVGGALGIAGQGLSDGVMVAGKKAAAAVSPQLRDLARYGESIGLPLTGADVAKSEAVKRLASMADALPLSGAAGRQSARSDAVGKQVAKLIGQDAGELNQGVMAKAYADLGQQYDTFFKDGMAVDRTFFDKLGSVQKFADENLDDTASKAAANFVNRAIDQLQGGRISGATLQSLDQQARKLATGGGDRQQVMQELRAELHEAFGRQGGMGDAWRDLNRKYANYKTIEPLIARNPEGIAPEQLLQAVNATKMGKARMARGQAGDIGDLALLGRQMRPPRTSKTPEGLLNLALGAGTALAPSVAIPLGLLGNVGGRVLNSPVSGRFLLREGRGQGAQAVSPYLRPAFMPAGGLLSEQFADDPRKRP